MAILTIQYKVLYILLAAREGNVFTPVCMSFSPPGMTTMGGGYVPTMATGDVSTTAYWGCLQQGVCLIRGVPTTAYWMCAYYEDVLTKGVCTQGRYPTPEPTAVVATHPSRIHYCIN